MLVCFPDFNYVDMILYKNFTHRRIPLIFKIQFFPLMKIYFD
jgi:hypothetical protein